MERHKYDDVIGEWSIGNKEQIMNKEQIKKNKPYSIFLPIELWMHIKSFIFKPKHRYYLDKITPSLNTLFTDIELFHNELVNYYNHSEVFMWGMWSFPQKINFIKQYRKHFNEQLCGDTLRFR